MPPYTPLLWTLIGVGPGQITADLLRLREFLDRGPHSLKANCFKPVGWAKTSNKCNENTWAFDSRVSAGKYPMT